QRDIEISRLLPRCGRIEDLSLPIGCCESRVEGLLEVAGDAADAGHIGHEAEGDPGGFGPEVRRCGVEQEAIFQALHSGTDRPRPGPALWDTSSLSITDHGGLPES